MKQVYIAQDPTEAHLIRGLLEAEGIEAIVQGEHLFTIRGGVPLTPDTSPSVWIVQDAYFARARELVEQLNQKGAPSVAKGETWQCNQCGESLEGQFTECWRCGASRSPEQ